MYNKTKPIISIDGQMYCGKSTLANKIAAKYSLYHLETGLLYRAFACALREKKSYSSFEIINMGINLSEYVNNPDIRSEEISNSASIVAKDKIVREFITDIQKKEAYAPQGDYKGVVVEGKDSGFSICPDADCKLYLSASLDERARRKIINSDSAFSLDEVIDSLKRIDTMDMDRVAEDIEAKTEAQKNYIKIDTTNLTGYETFLAADKYIEGIFSGK